MTKADWDRLEEAAAMARENAHAPYSKYKVGAAIQVASGRIFAGCNVENASYSLTLCAERSAIVQMVSVGERDPIALVVITEGPVAASPCGACRQTLAEFALDLPIELVSATDKDARRRTTLAALLPDAFRAEALGK